MSRISIRMDEGLRKEADAILEELGLNMSAAVHIFIRQLVRQGGLPFVPTLETNQVAENKRREHLASLLSFASKNKRIESSYRLCHDRGYDK